MPFGYYNCLSVSAIVFAFILLFPTQEIYILFIPRIPGFIFGVLYLVISSVLARRGGSHINHSAHFWGAVYGIVFTIGATMVLTTYNLPQMFLQQVEGYFSSF